MQPPDTVIDIATHYCEIHIFADQYKRFRSLNEKWEQLVDGDLVLCRTTRRNPAFVFCDGKRAMTCGRVVSTESREFGSWKRASETHTYIGVLCVTSCTVNVCHYQALNLHQQNPWPLANATYTGSWSRHSLPGHHFQLDLCLDSLMSENCA